MVVHPVACESDFGEDDCFIFVCQPEWCLSRGCPRRCSICLQYARQFLRPYALCPLKPSLDDLEQGSVRDLDLPVGLWVGGGGVVVHDS